MNFKTLYAESKNGKIKQWTISTKDNIIITEHGYIDGAITKTQKIIHKGKNIGKKNETTPKQQAEKEAKAKYKLQLRKGYVEKQEDIGKKEDYRPMLAKTLDPDKTKLPEYALVQPKLDGVRCVAVNVGGKITFWSRTMKEFGSWLDDIKADAKRRMIGDCIWDGEFYVHGWDFERITRAVKKNRIECYREDIRKPIRKRDWNEVHRIMRERHDTQKLQFHVFDIPMTGGVQDQIFRVRSVWINTDSVIHRHSTHIKFVKASWVQSMEEVLKKHDQYVQNGYEGLILREGMSKYLWGHRGAELLKYKEFVDEEFVIVGYYPGTGVDEGAINFICHIDGDRTRCLPKDDKHSGYFDVRPKGTIDDRRRMYLNGWTYVGKMYTVRYQQRTQYNVPKFGVGIGVRDYE